MNYALTAAPPHMAAPPQDSRFSLAVAARLVANLVLVASIAYALQAFMGWLPAVPVALVLTYVFGQLADIAVEQGLRSWRGALAIAGMVIVGTITTSLSYATFYARTSAAESARREYLSKKERTEREAQRVLTMATAAQLALTAWSQDAAEKSAVEERQGNTCATRPSDRLPGPISQWRKDDAKVAGTVGAEMLQLVSRARQAVESAAQSPAPEDFKAIKAGYTALNAAIDAVAALGKGGFADGALKTVADRRSSQIDHPGGRMSCGDSGRVSMIERATVELSKLNETPSMARLAPSIDLDRPADVVTRGLVRGANLTAGALTLGRGANFEDDPLMKDSLAKNGWFNTQTVPYLLSLLAELGVLLTSFVAARAGRSPFRMAMPDWVQAQERHDPTPSVVPRWVRRGAKLASNLFWTVPDPSTEAPPAPARPGQRGPESSGFKRIDLVDDPTINRDRERGYAASLKDFHHAWGMDDYIVLPIDRSTDRQRTMVRTLASHGLAELASDGAEWKIIARRVPLARALREHLGEGCERMLYQIWRVKPEYGHLLRLAVLD